MPFLGKTPAQGFVNSVTKDDFTPNGTTTAFTLSKSPATVNELEVYVGNVRQEPTDAYSVSGTTLTMTEAPATGTNFYVMHIGGTTQSSTVVGDGTVTSAKLSGALTTPSTLAVSGDLAVDTSAFFVDASTNKVGIGTASPGQELDISSTNPAVRLTDTTTSGLYHDLVSYGNDLRFSADGGGVEADTNIEFYIDNAEKMRITSDGRGLSQFTAKAWVNFNGSGTLAVNDSHNVSSVTDHEVGNYSINFANNMANANYSSTITSGNWETTNEDSYTTPSLYDTASGQTTAKQKFRIIRLRFDGNTVFKDPKTVCATFFGD